MSDTSETAEAILAAARRSIRTRGAEKLTISAVAIEAGLSRPTIYRWFPNKSLLLASLTAYEVEQFDNGLRALADTYPDPAARIDAALRFLIRYLDESLGAHSVNADLEFSLQSLADSLQPQSESLARVLGDALDQIPAVARRYITRQQGAEMLLRLAYSHYLVPHADSEQLIAVLRAFAGLDDTAVGPTDRVRPQSGTRPE